MKINERVKMVKAMEFIARQVNHEGIFGHWLAVGVADGDIEYGDLSSNGAEDEAAWYADDDKCFAELMGTFLELMAAAHKNGGLYCDRVVSKSDEDEDEDE